MFFSGIEDGINNLNRIFCENILSIKIGENKLAKKIWLCFVKQEKMCSVLTMSKENN